MGRSVVREPFRAMSGVLPDFASLQRGAVANARAAVERDRRAAADRARVEAAADPFALLVPVAADDVVA